MMKNSFSNSNGAGIVLNIIEQIKANKMYLTDIDGHIGDGDHGINMNKGFSIAGEIITMQDGFSSAMKALGDTLLLEIGGSMGPIYGTFFRTCAKVTKNVEDIDAQTFSRMLLQSCREVQEIGGAKPGDKTMIDTLYPAAETFEKSVEEREDFKAAISAASAAAKSGWESTRMMQAKIGRASRLGERSVGVLDAGATSCNIILQAMFSSVLDLLD